MADLLLELFSEEIPARMQEDAQTALSTALLMKLKTAGFDPATTTFSTPRRLAVHVTGLPTQQADVSTELKGPKLDAPDQAIQGFLKKSGMKLEQLQKRDGIYVAKIEQKGKPTAEVLKPLIEEILKNFPWPKSMRWGAGEQPWVRSLHSILCIFDSKVVPVEFAGIKAGNATYGHRFLGAAKIEINKVDEYETKLEKAFVIADREKRKAKILAEAEKAAAAQKLALKKDDGLLEEVTGLVEWPVVLVGSIDKNYMDLPPEVLVSEMRAHQKYFALENAGKLADKFLITSNMETADKGKAIIAGNERVLRARLADGRFFWDQDRKKKLAEMAEGLKTVTYHAKLGSVADKVERVKKLSNVILSEAKDLLQEDSSPAAQNDMKKKVERAAALCKADLVSGMVGEFPELQGVMGRYYALAQKESAEVADAIRDHYLPLGPASPVPTKPVSVCVALADKLDTLISMFAISEKPTGSKDPFALRRAALGIIRIILENNIRLPLKKLVNDELIAFFHDRLIVQLKDSGIRHDVIKAVVAGGDDDLVRVVARAKAVQEFLGTEDGKNLLAGYKRAANILSIEEKKDKTSYNLSGINLSLLKEQEEIALAENDLAATIRLHQEKEDFVAMMKTLAVLRKPVDQFFEKIMVNVNDPEVRATRLALLAGIRERMNMVADFGLIEG